MEKRVAVVTGGVGGLGRAICQALHKQERTVVAVDLPQSDQALDDFRQSLGQAKAEFRSLDVSDLDDCKRVFADIEASFGPVEILVNAAGITRDASLRKMRPEDWRAVMAVDLDALFHTCQQVIDGMMSRGFGRIINISSVNGQTGQFGQTNYAAAKAGVHGFTMALAREGAAKGVTVNSISPGYIDTAMTRAIRPDIREQIIAGIPVGRIGRPEDIARTVAFLSADDADFITGSNIPVNGGHFISF
ncbi:acetoacetyl-CoA reductase [Pseudomarimonas arenosa]|uniref:Acetoacetyl-CoA reductase n=1 Tax=Pseudomarimonas arenosa TaxID=2774145 RepID=A0AAW3ZMQ1_9GAMM|nr:acetoacetyl-CoA reductase [Pseudomarimonas arenosa]MBD8525929.1 acetoacetyl-CoA reductase [Pseudomarimonas arenosa]